MMQATLRIWVAATDAARLGGRLPPSRTEGPANLPLMRRRIASRTPRAPHPTRAWTRAARAARAPHLPLALLSALVAAGCGGRTVLIQRPAPVIQLPSTTPQTVQPLPAPVLATKNTTRFDGSDPTADAAQVALAVYPSAGPGTHPQAVILAPTDDWQAAFAATVLAGSPISAPVLLSPPGALPAVTAAALKALAPTGAGAAGGAQVIGVGDVPSPAGYRTVRISGSGGYALAAAVDRFSAAAHGSAASNIVITSGDDPTYAMPAAGWAAESGEPILFVNSGGIPQATKQALLSHPHPHIYVLGPSSVIPDSVMAQLRQFGPVNRIAGGDPVSTAVAFSEYRNPPCTYGQPCAHYPGAFGWAIRSPGHGYVLINLHRPLDAAAAAPLSSSGDFGPQLLIDDPTTLPSAVSNYLAELATPGYTSEGPTAAVYNHAWVIGDSSACSVAVQAEVDKLLEPEPVQ
jgi:hypothetical protein